MDFALLIFIFFLSSLGYFLFTSYNVQVLLYKKRFKKELRESYINSVKGRFQEEGFFSSSKRVITKKSYMGLARRQKINFTRCYNIIHFKTQDADWELFFHLEKEGMLYRELMTLKVFPYSKALRSQASIEKLHNRLNILGNNRYLTELLEEAETRQVLNQILQKPGDSMQIETEMLSLKRDMRQESKLSKEEFLDLVHLLHSLRNKVFKAGIIEY